MTPSDAILLEDMEAQARVIEEATPVCLHGYVTVYKYVDGSPLQDHSTSWGFCNECSEWLVLTDFANGRVDERRMSAAEMVAWETETTMRRHAEWLDDFQSGIGL